ncbi:MAG: hypothetical protein FJW40_14605 [Acidobacteria bacterium]|nr:hypothetical protein [Acidobacteriota bacterium]
MTLALRICSSAALAASLLHAGHVSGSVELAESRDPRVQKKDFSGVAVWLEPVPATAPPAPRDATIVQRGKRFTPHITIVPAGSTVDFPNFDPIFHNAFSNFAGQRFDTGLYRPGSTQKVTFRREGAVRVFCNIHATMSAVIVVVPTALYALTTRDGRFEIPNVPPGEYSLRLFHERAPEATLKALERRLTAGPDGASVPAIRISESGHIEAPHKNKFGQEYQGPPADNAAYPGTRR